MSDIDRKVSLRGMLEEICQHYYDDGKAYADKRIAALEAELAAARRSARAALLELEAELAAVTSKLELLASCVLEYPEFDCDEQREPRPLCAMARGFLDTIAKAREGK